MKVTITASIVVAFNLTEKQAQDYYGTTDPDELARAEQRLCAEDGDYFISQMDGGAVSDSYSVQVTL